MNIYFFGDSISFGQGISIDYIWVNRLAAALHDRFGEKEITVVNTSINGNTTRMALERMPYDVQSHDVDILVVGFGMNDCNYWVTDQGIPRVSPDAFRANMQEIADRGFHFGAGHVVLHTNHPSPREDIMCGTQITYHESNRRYNEIIRNLALEDKRITFVDVEKIFEERINAGGNMSDSFTLPDGVHLSMQGHKLYFEIMYPVIAHLAESRQL